MSTTYPNAVHGPMSGLVRLMVLVCGSLLAASCSGKDTQTCVPGAQERGGETADAILVRNCNPDGEWGNFYSLSKDDTSDPQPTASDPQAETQSCLQPGSYLLHKTLVDGTSICPEFPAELVVITSDGGAVGAAPPAGCADDLTIDGCHRTLERTCTDGTSLILDGEVAIGGEGTMYVVGIGAACLYETVWTLAR
jgi:hypothetical protein